MEDVETRTGFKHENETNENYVSEENSNMDLMSYSISLVFSEDLRHKQSYKSIYQYRSIVQDKKSLGTSHLSEFIRRYKSSKDVHLLNESINKIINGYSHALAHHLLLEIMLMIKWTKRHFEHIVIPSLSNLLSSTKSKYNKESNEKNCYICGFELHNENETRNELINSDRIKFEIRKEYTQLYNTYCMNHSIFTDNPEMFTESEYIVKMKQVLQNYAMQNKLDELNDIEQNLSATGESIPVDATQYPEFTKEIKFLHLNNCKTVEELKNLILNNLDTDDSTINSSDESEWCKKLLLYLYRKETGTTWNLSPDFVQRIHLFLFDPTVIHHDHCSGRIYGPAHDSCNRAVQFSIRTLPICVYAHNAQRFDIKFLIKGINLSEWGVNDVMLTGKSSGSVDSIQISTQAVFRDSLKFLEDSLENLSNTATPNELKGIKSDTITVVLSHPHFNDVYQKMSNEKKEIAIKCLSKKGAIAYDQFVTGGELLQTELPPKESFTSSLKMDEITDEMYSNIKEIWSLFEIKNLDQLNYLYNMSDVIILANIVNKRLYDLSKLFVYEPKHFASTTGFSSAALARHSRHILVNPTSYKLLNAFEMGVRGGYSSIPQRLAFDTAIRPGPKITPYVYNSVTSTHEKYNFYVKTFKVDENNQYGMSMTRCLPTDAVQLIMSEDMVDPVTKQNFTEQLLFDKTMSILSHYDHTNSIFGYYVNVDLEPPDKSQVLEIALCEAYMPIFERVIQSVNDMSTFYLHTHTEYKINGDPKKISPTLKTHSTLRKRREEYVFIETLIYCLQNLGWKLTKVHEIYKFRQSEWMSSYVLNNQLMRQKAANKVESDFYKAMNNKGDGGRMTKGYQNVLKPIVDYAKEHERFENVNNRNCRNPFATSKSMEVTARQKYLDTVNNYNFSEDGNNTARKALQKDLISAAKQREYENKRKQKLYHPHLPNITLNESLKSPYMENITEYDDSQSIKGIISEKKKTLHTNSRMIGSNILSSAKLQIATFIHAVIKLFHPLTLLIPGF